MIQPPKQYKYTKKETAFCNFYSDFHFKETFSDALKSFLAAGYAAGKSAMANACNILYKQKIREYCAKILNENLDERIKKGSISGSFADQELLLGILACKDKISGEITDKANHLGYVRLLQQRVGQLNEKLQIELTTAPQLQQAMQRELSDLAKLRCLLPASDNEQPAKVIESTIIESDNVSTEQDSEQSEIPMPDFLNGD